MTHHEAIERSKRAIAERDDCHRGLVDLGVDPDEPTLRLWACSRCQVALAIDPAGVVRDWRRLGD